MRQLSNKELHLLLLMTFDKHDYDNNFVSSNCLPFRKQAFDIYELLNGGNTTNKYLTELIIETEDELIDIESVRDIYGKQLPGINDKKGIRECRLRILGE
jgi:hypothetical protein